MQYSEGEQKKNPTLYQNMKLWEKKIPDKGTRWGKSLKGRIENILERIFIPKRKWQWLSGEGFSRTFIRWFLCSQKILECSEDKWGKSITVISRCQQKRIARMLANGFVQKNLFQQCEGKKSVSPETHLEIQRPHPSVKILSKCLNHH